jgi:hypothetical protein
MIKLKFDLYHGQTFLSSIFFAASLDELRDEGKRHYEKYKITCLSDTDVLTAGQKCLEKFWAIQLQQRESFESLKIEWIYDYEQ